MRNKVLILVMIISVMALSGCRSWRSEKPPVHPNPNMDWQAKVKPQTMNLQPPEGTVAWGRGAISDANETRDDYLQSDGRFYTGKNSDGSWVKRVPIDVDAATLDRGEERYDIYCAMCHDRAGTGRGPVIERGFIPPPNLSDARILAYSDGALFDVISNGVRNMPSYRKQIPETDRWAIVTYIRVLQKMNTATLKDVPASKRSEIEE